jgi:hypothetical protein
VRVLAAKLSRFEAELARREQAAVVAIVLEGLERVSPWAMALEGGRQLRVLGLAKSRWPEVVPFLALDDADRPPNLVALTVRRYAAAFVQQVVDGPAYRVCCWSPRGEGKSYSALISVMLLADLHREAGFAGPLQVLLLSGSHVEMSLKIVRTVQEPEWRGCWGLRRDEREIVLTIGGRELARLDLIGTGDSAAMDRARAQSHLVWAEELCAAVDDSAGGVDRQALAMAMTSARLRTGRKVVLLTSNYPGRQHWAWQEYGTDGPGAADVAVIRIPPEERASAADRAQWGAPLAPQPALYQRLIVGEPAEIPQGPRIAVAFNPQTHVAAKELAIRPGQEFITGVDTSPGAHHHALVIGSVMDDEVYVYAALYGERGFQEFLEVTARGWFAKWAPWALKDPGRYLRHYGDPNMDTAEGGDINLSPVRRLKASVGGTWHAGPVSQLGRLAPLFSLLNQSNGRGGMRLQIDPCAETAGLREALHVGWVYATTKNGQVERDTILKPCHPHEDFGDGICYFACGLAPTVTARRVGPRVYTARGVVSSWTHTPWSQRRRA